ncbi:heparinase II/III family protein [Acuticoccus mangrovi]|uniref:Heparinase II/III family protein n=1 Tax=Acuticoccus mangrovi TaxID=2796142 RepID=A0A934MI72_9HYPH|nr:heparinase II/III family protein [Acuticoccus mangrovi]MBJ3777640.1 heparinase II/III family protein [Acuticoccus mangrovi]
MPQSGRSPTVTTLPALIGFGARRLGARALANVALLLWKRPVSGVPARVLFAPETLAEADPAVAADIYAGVFALAGDVVDVSGGSPFLMRPPSEAWARALHGFTWLHHLEANATELSHSNARALFDEWLAARGEADPVSDEMEVVAERLAVWLVQSPLLLNGAEAAFRQRYMRAIARHMRQLERAVVLSPKGMQRLLGAATLGIAGAVIADQAKLLRWALGVVADELPGNVLADGGHASRSPEALVKVLEVLIPLSEALARRQLPTPPPLRDAIDRMMPMVRFFRHGDGGLAHFHGAGHVSAATVEAVLAYDDVAGQPAANARYTGFQRIEAGASAVIFDTGRVPPPAHSLHAHASALAFEFSHGPHRLVVNCGALDRVRPEWEGAARTTAAQSSLVVAETSSARILERWPLAGWLGALLYRGPRSVEVEREKLTARAVHDGYRRPFGLLHERRLTLSEDGLWLEGEDRLVGRERLAGMPFEVRFHLDPDVKVRVERTRKRALFSLPDGAIWLFGLDQGPPISVEESIVLSGPRRARRTVQLVMAGNTLTDDTVRWHIARHAAPLDNDAGNANKSDTP